MASFSPLLLLLLLLLLFVFIVVVVVAILNYEVCSLFLNKNGQSVFFLCLL